MAKAKVIHSTNSCMIKFMGDKRKPEPETGIISFPGGHVEVTRTTDGKYWAHIEVNDPSNVVSSRIDYNHEGYIKSGGQSPDIPHAEHIQHLAIMVDGPYLEEFEK